MILKRTKLTAPLYTMAAAVEGLLCEHTGEERANCSAESVRGHDVERVVQRRFGPDDEREVARNCRQDVELQARTRTPFATAGADERRS